MKPTHNTLNPGQIRYLYLWVHPKWKSPWTEQGVEAEIREYSEFVGRIKESPHAALVQIADAPRSEFQECKVYQQLLRELGQFNEQAAEILGRRYWIWNETRFFDARNPEAVRKLVDRFNLTERLQHDFVLERERWMAQEPKYLAKITVFGKERDTCPLGQATRFDLHRIASIIRYLGYETPKFIRPPTLSDPFPGDGEATYIFKQ